MRSRYEGFNEDVGDCKTRDGDEEGSRSSWELRRYGRSKEEGGSQLTDEGEDGIVEVPVRVV